MKFFGRQNEIKELQEIRNLSLQTARFTIVTGRRRSGKSIPVMEMPFVSIEKTQKKTPKKSPKKKRWILNR